MDIELDMAVKKTIAVCEYHRAPITAILNLWLASCTQLSYG